MIYDWKLPLIQIRKQERRPILITFSAGRYILEEQTFAKEIFILIVGI